MRQRTARRSMLACSFVGALVALTACGAPAQPPPRPGGATLSGAVIPYDHPEFLTNRQPVLRSGKECESMQAVLDELGVKGEKEQYDDPAMCGLTFADAGLNVSSSPAPFAQYWTGDTVNNKVLGAAAPGDAPSSFSRRIMSGKYHAAVFTLGGGTPFGACYTAVDTGSARTLVVSAYPVDESGMQNFKNEKPIRVLEGKYCKLASNFAEKVLETLDPQGGSRTA